MFLLIVSDEQERSTVVYYFKNYLPVMKIVDSPIDSTFSK